MWVRGVRRGVAVPAAYPLPDRRLGADQQAGEQDQPGDDLLEHLGREGEQEDRAGDRPDGAGEDHQRGDDGVLAQLAPVAERAAQPAGGHADRVGRVRDDRRQADRDQDREAQQGRDAHGRGHDARRRSPAASDGQLFESRHSVSRRRATSLTISTWECMAVAAASESPARIASAIARWPASESQRTARLGEGLDPRLLDQVADLVHQPRQQQGVGGGGDGAVEPLVSLDARGRRPRCPAPWRASASSIRARSSSVRRAAASAAILVSSASRVSITSGSRSACARIASTIRPAGGLRGQHGAVAVPDGDHADHLQRDQRLAQRGPADSEPGRELALGREPVAGLEPVGRDPRRDLLRDLLVQASTHQPFGEHWESPDGVSRMGPTLLTSAQLD